VSGFIGIDLGGTQLRVAVADARGTVKTVIRVDTEAHRGLAVVGVLPVRGRRLRSDHGVLVGEDLSLIHI